MHTLLLLAATGCSDWIMNDEYGLSVRTMDLGKGADLDAFNFKLQTQPKGTAVFGLKPNKYGYIMNHGNNFSTVIPHYYDGVGQAGLNEAGLSCDMHTLLNSSYPPKSGTSKDLQLKYFCMWALGGFASTAEVKAALQSGEVHLWGPKEQEDNADHFIVRDAQGVGLAVEFMEHTTKLYDDLNDGDSGFGVFTNEPTFPWQVQNVKHYLWKQSLARPATTMPGAWYPDERFLRIFLTKTAMPKPRSYQEAVQHALHVLNTITVPMGQQMGTDSGFGEGAADHTHWGHIYDHKNKVLYWRAQSNLQLERVRLADVLSSPTPLSLPIKNDLPFFQDASHKFARN